MEASFVVPGSLDVAGTLFRFRLWGEDPPNPADSLNIEVIDD